MVRERATMADLVAAGRDLLERHGLDGVTMAGVADAVGIQPPSLYKRLRDRDDLVRHIAEAIADDLSIRVAIVRQTGPSEPRAALLALLRDLRAFARDQPHGYALVFGPVPAAARPRQEALRRVTAPVLELVSRLTGEAHAVAAARTVTAWISGVLLLEHSRAYRSDADDLDATFEWGLERMVDAVIGHPGS